MIGLTAKELSAIRTDINGLLPDTGYILAGTQTNDGMGGGTIAWGTVAGGTVSCRLDPKSTYGAAGNEQVTSGALQPFHSFVLTLPYDTTITTKNKFVVNGQTYNITSVDTDKSWKASVRAYLERI